MSTAGGPAAGTPERPDEHAARAAPDVRRVAVRVDGVVQGVGFRPYVFRLAEENGVAGFVLNDTRGVAVEVEGPADAVARFLEALPREAPPLARVEQVTTVDVAPLGTSGFEIVVSDPAGSADALVAVDTATCADCLREIFDPADRRFRYPFANCTNCGPRFTIVRDVPYDRPLTTMAGFAMCADCQAEYDDPRDRRFHAQPNACPVCGPRAVLEGDAVAGACDAVAAAASLLRDGAIVAVKGIGGYHLACRADDELAVATLRSRKHREDKPFALMAADVEAARGLVELDDAALALLVAVPSPIVLAPRRDEAAVAVAVAPGLRELGVMLPSTPLHHLLLADAGTQLVMTSGNVSDEPIAYRDEDARERLATIADAFLLHDRPVHMRTDDSVVRAVACRPLTLRRSRGHVPESIALPVEAARPLLACGAELKATFCIARGARAWVSHHIGDLQNAETVASFVSGVEHFERLFAVAPEVVAHDLHPDYRSTAYAMERDGVELLGVQHHHAHLAAAIAEHGDDAPAVGAIYDGAGLGTDGTVWGGELLAGDLRGFERVGHLWPVALPGGDRAAQQPWRMACSWLLAAGDGEDPEQPAVLRETVDPERWAAVTRLACSDLAPVTSSMGRLFDAVAALCGVRAELRYEGQAAIELEALADLGAGGSYELPLTRVGGEGPLLLDARATVSGVVADLAAGAHPAAVSARFHRTVARATAEACEAAASALGTDRVVLSGGCFLNRVLLADTSARLAAAGLRVLVPERLPPGDGGISYGQAAVAAACG